MVGFEGHALGAVTRTIRAYARTPALTAAVLVAVALGVGTNTAILSVVDATWLRPLPFDDASSLLTVWLEEPADSPDERLPLTGADLADLRSEPALFAALSGWTPFTATLAGADGSEVVPAAAVSEGMFSRVLRVQPVLGRTFLPEEDRPGASPTVVLGHGFWTEHFGADPGAIGRAVSLDGEPHVVVGVMPRGFEPPFAPGARLWTPLRMSMERCRGTCTGVPAIARLATGTTLPVARDHAVTLGSRLAESYPDTNAGVVPRMALLGRDRSALSSETVRLLSLAGGLVLLIACVNVGLLLVARGLDRADEMRIRRCVGAARPSVVAQLVRETVGLALLGGVLGLGVAVWGVEALTHLAPADLVDVKQVSVDERILVFAVLLTVGTGALSGLMPALVIGRDPWRARGAPERRASGPWGVRRLLGPRLLRRGVVAAQVGLAAALAVGAGGLLKGLHSATTSDLGFDPDGVVAVRMAPAPGRVADPLDRGLLVARLEDELETMPGAFSVGAAGSLPLEEVEGPFGMVVEDAPPPGDDTPSPVRVRRVSDGYFYTLGQRLVEGRWFRSADDRRSEPVVILNATAARRFFGDPPRSPLGSRVALRAPAGGSSLEAEAVRAPAGARWRTVVGVVRDERAGRAGRPSEAVVYLPVAQSPPAALSLVVRVDGDVSAGLEAARVALDDVDGGLGGFELAPMRELVGEAYAAERFGAALAAVFAVVALLLSVIGLYGIVAHGVATRLRELGLRRAIGASDDDLRRLVVGRALRVTFAGLVVGAVGAGFVVRGMDAALAGTGIRTPLVYALVVSVMAAGALVAGARPARRSVTMDPMTALRAE